MSKRNLYDDLKSVIELISDKDRLSFFETAADESLDNALAYSDMEEGLVNYMSNMELGNKANIGVHNVNLIKESLGITTVNEEKNFFTKLFMRDYQSNYDEKYKFKKEINISKVFNDFASEELREDKEFIRVVLMLDGKYLESMNNNIRNDFELVKLAIKNDSTTDIISFKSASDDLRKNSLLATKYFQKLKSNNQFVSVNEVYENIFKKDSEGNFSKDIFKNNEQNEWLKDNEFLIFLIELNYDFLNYITDGKISLTKEDGKENYEKRKHN